MVRSNIPLKTVIHQGGECSDHRSMLNRENNRLPVAVKKVLFSSSPSSPGDLNAPLAHILKYTNGAFKSAGVDGDLGVHRGGERPDYTANRDIHFRLW